MNKVLQKSVRKLALKSGSFVADALELVLIDLAYGKAKYRRRGPRLRPIIHRTYNRRTVIVQQPVPIVRHVRSTE